MRRNNKGGGSYIGRIVVLGVVLTVLFFGVKSMGVGGVADRMTSALSTGMGHIHSILDGDGLSDSDRGGIGSQDDRPYEDYLEDSVAALESNVAPRGSGEGYDRSNQFDTWANTGSDDAVRWDDFELDTCNVREAILITYGDDVEYDNSCNVTGGTWTGMYGVDSASGDIEYYTSNDRSEFDVEHVVPLNLAYRSGADSWTNEKRAAIANDEANLLLAHGPVNMSKGAKGVDEWTPPMESENYCNYMDRYAYIHAEYDLTVTSDELSVLQKAVEYCG